jgi:hypothetical protein
MTKTVDGKVDRIESAANISLIISEASKLDDAGLIGDGVEPEQPSGFIEVPISRLDTTKEVEISEVRESSLKANGYSITSISYSGTMMFKGSRITKVMGTENSDGTPDDGTQALETFMYDGEGVPIPLTIQIDHDLNDESEVYEHVLVTSESYEVRSEETTETAFDWVAMDRQSDQPDAN